MAWKPEKRIDLLGVPLDALTMEETVALADDAMRSKNRLQHVVVNVAKFVNMRSDADLRADVIGSDVISIDGMGIVIACRLLGFQQVERVTGIDLMHELLKLCARKGYRPYIFGCTQEVLERAVGVMEQTYSGIQIAGYRNGYFSTEEEPAIVEAIRSSGADCLLIAISSPLKERFMRRYRDELGVSFIMGVGGSVDVLAGLVRRAPRWVQNLGMEWAYRVFQEPRRLWKRYFITNTRFLIILARAIVVKGGTLVRSPARQRLDGNE